MKIGENAEPGTIPDPTLCATAYISGPLRIVTKKGQDITPNGAIQSALIAVLITAPGQRVSRITLRDMFWGDCTAKTGATNLRTKLAELRARLAVLGDDLIDKNNDTVMLAPNRIKLAPFVNWGPDLMDGLNLEGQGREGFEDWLRSLRQGARTMFDSSIPVQDLRQGVGLLPTLYANATAEEVFQVNRLIDHLMVQLMHTTQVSVHDFREFQETMFSQPIEEGDGPSALLQATIIRGDDNPKFCLRLRQNDGQKVLWMSEDIRVGVTATDFVAQISHYLLDHLMRHSSAVAPASLFPWTGIAALFSLNAVKIESTALKIAELSQMAPSPALECLRWFVSVFRFGEGIGTAQEFDLDGYAELYEQLDDQDPLYGLNLSLLGYSMHMILGDNTRALFLLNEAKRAAPNLALTYDHLAVVQLATDDLDAAEASSRISCHLGRFSGLRYTYDTTRAMVALAKGDAETAALFANKATLRKPRFLGAMRVGAASQALMGNTTEATMFARSIERINPNFDDAQWSENLLQRYPGRYGAALMCGLTLLDKSNR